MGFEKQGRLRSGRFVVHLDDWMLAEIVIQGGLLLNQSSKMELLQQLLVEVSGGLPLLRLDYWLIGTEGTIDDLYHMLPVKK